MERLGGFHKILTNNQLSRRDKHFECRFYHSTYSRLLSLDSMSPILDTNYLILDTFYLLLSSVESLTVILEGMVIT